MNFVNEVNQEVTNRANGMSEIEGKSDEGRSEQVWATNEFSNQENLRLQNSLNIRVYSWLLLLRDCLERRNRFVDRNPRQFVFEEDRFLRFKGCRIVERRDCEINRVGVFAILKEQMRAATRGKRPNSIRVQNLPRLTFRQNQVFAWH